MVRAVFRNSLIAAALALSAAVPAGAQMFSDGYEFLKAVKDRDGTKVTQALDQPGSTVVNTRDLSTGETALHIVTQRRDLVWMRFLMERGANPNVKDKRGVTPLVLASNLGFVEGVEALLKRGATVDEANAAGETPLIAAVHRRDMPMVRLLLANGADPDRTDNSGRTARDFAVLQGEGNRILSEIETADAKRAEGGKAKTYGPGM